MRWLLRSGAVVVLAIALLGASVQAEEAPAVAGPAPQDWLGELNLLRALAKLPPVSDVPSWSSRNAEHARWMVENDRIDHTETPGTPWYSTSGQLGASRSNVALASYPIDAKDAVDQWMTGPFHGVGLIDPGLTRSGYGGYYNPGSPSMKWGAALDVLSDGIEPGRTPPPAASYPVRWPSPGSTLHLRSYGGNESPNPLTTCPGYTAPTGTPLYVLFASPNGSVTSSSLTRTNDGASMPVCTFDWTNYNNPNANDQNLGRNVLGRRNAVVVMPRSPLENGKVYRLNVTRNGVTATSTFNVGPEGAPPPTAPVGSFELVSSPSKGNLRVKGWTADWSAPGMALDVHVYLDNGAGVNTGKADDPRADIGTTWPDFGPNHGFDATFAAEPGQRNACAYAINVGPGGNTLLGCRSVWVPDPASPFTDVLSASPFFADIVWLLDEEYTTGYTDGSFKPTAPVTRQAMARYLYLAAGSPPGPFEAPAFIDVPADHPFAEEIAWMASTGLTTGYADGTFRPTATVTRQATAAFLWRTEGEPEPLPDAPTFPDVKVGHPFRDAISWMAGEDITGGYVDGGFRPGSAVSRQAMAAFLHRWKT